ncbi:hypothetical protein M2101_000618 [Parabacteroides sp. PM5-20]|nr:hypothetical protein [Parabacteroides sp. PM5-20]
MSKSSISAQSEQGFLLLFRFPKVNNCLLTMSFSEVETKKACLHFKQAFWWVLFYKPLPWQALYFLPLPQGQGSLRPTLFSVRIGSSLCCCCCICSGAFGLTGA